MTAPESNPESHFPWTHGTHTGLVSIGLHSLFLRASGLARMSPSQPAVIIEAGLGGSSSEWVAAQRLISQFARVYSYDRAGYAHSITAGPDPLPASARPPTASKMVEELTKLLENAGVAPPWVIVGHSYGGILVREFLLRHGKEKVVGMVIVDSAITRTKLPDDWFTLLGDSTYQEVVGLDKNHCLTDEEYAQLQKEETSNQPTVVLEEAEMPESTNSVNQRISGKQLLGDGRLSVIFANESVDFRKVYEWGVKHGNGTEAAREALRKRLEYMGEIDEKRAESASESFE
jgi:pimeloyl-ACP methyl ester carboxylesterase